MKFHAGLWMCIGLVLTFFSSALNYIIVRPYANFCKAGTLEFLGELQWNKTFLIVFDAPKLFFSMKNSVAPEPAGQFDVPLCKRVSFCTLNTNFFSNLLKIVVFNF